MRQIPPFLQGLEKHAPTAKIMLDSNDIRGYISNIVSLCRHNIGFYSLGQVLLGRGKYNTFIIIQPVIVPSIMIGQLSAVSHIQLWARPDIDSF